MSSRLAWYTFVRLRTLVKSPGEQGVYIYVSARICKCLIISPLPAPHRIPPSLPHPPPCHHHHNQSPSSLSPAFVTFLPPPIRAINGIFYVVLNRWIIWSLCSLLESSFTRKVVHTGFFLSSYGTWENHFHVLIPYRYI